ncbi:MAG: hypothetical protein R8G66_30160 [Cytophagales bacterium]|nr:hypothetical protein [Cytophagales bacterium]
MKEDLNKKLESLNQVDLETSWSRDDLWEAIESKMEDQKPRRRFLTEGWRTLPWAAAAMVLITLGLFWWSTQPVSDVIEVVEIETIGDPILEMESEVQLAEGKLFIHEACRKELEICESPTFIQLYRELNQIEEEKTLLAEAVKQYGADEIATRAMIQLENAESSITSQLVSMIVI